MPGIKIVRCKRSECEAYSFCTHAIDHAERRNCYNGKPEERMTKVSHHIVCPECEPVGNTNGH